MTVIVATERGMWADSRCGVGGAYFPTEKVFARKGELIGTAGGDSAIQHFLDWYGGPRKKIFKYAGDEEFIVVVVNAKGIFTYANSSVANRVLRPFMAIGIGAPAAYGALFAGASPRRSIEIACEVCEGCGPPVQEFLLGKKGSYKFDTPQYGRGIKV